MDFLASFGLLAAAAFLAGALNAVAGGGSFLTFPALVFTGVPPIVANATSALAVRMACPVAEMPSGPGFSLTDSTPRQPCFSSHSLRW